MKIENKVYSLLGLAMKSRNLVSGEFSVEKSVKTKKAYLVIVAEDASDNTKKMFSNMCKFYETPIRFFGTKERLGNAIGKETRTSIALLNEGFGNNINKQIESIGGISNESI